MQGYIIRLQKVKDEDLMVWILNQSKIICSYRFYGARHSVINLGYKIDYELVHSHKSTIAQLRNVLHLSHPWLQNRSKTQDWQIFISLFYNHLKDVEEIENFYFDLLEFCASRWEKQNAKRLSIEAYLKLLEFEGRLHIENSCFLCEEQIDTEISLARGFLAAHPRCANLEAFDKNEIQILLKSKKTINLDDKTIESLWVTLTQGF